MGTGNHTSAQVTGSVTPINAINRRIEYTSSDSSKVSVQSGASSVESDIPITIYAVAVGSANITAKAWGDQSKTATCAVNVRQGCTGIAITEASLILYTGGDPVTLHTNVQPNNAYNQAVTFTSSNDNIATVDGNGKITPIRVGTCTITGTTQDTYYSAQQYSDTVSVEVKDPAQTITGIVIRGYSGGGVAIGDSIMLHVYYQYYDGHIGNVDIAVANNWVEQSYDQYFDLSGTGTFTAKSAGNPTIQYHHSTYGTVGQQVSVYSVAVTGVTLNTNLVEIHTGDTYQLVATVAPPNATDKRVTWSGGTNRVWSIDANGLISANGDLEGGGYATVTTVDGNKTAQAEVRVTYIYPTSVTLNSSGETISIGNTFQLTATVLPNNATNKSVRYTSDNTSVATVDRSTGLVTAVAGGSAIITCTTVLGSKTATCSIAVPNPAPTVVGVRILGYSGGGVNIGSSLVLHAYELLSNGQYGNEVTNASNWTYNGNYFSLSGAGTFTAIYEGSTDITFTYNSMSDTLHQVPANRYVSSIAITSYQTPVTLGSGAVQWGITATWRYATNGYTTTTPTSGVSWSSDNSGIASVNSNGQVSPVAVGSTTIRASYGGQPASQSITVTSQALSLTLSSDSVSMQDSSIDLSVSVTATEGATINVTSTNENLLYATYVSTTKLIRLTARGNASHDTTVNVTVTASKTGYSSVTKNLAVTILTDEPI